MLNLYQQYLDHQDSSFLGRISSLYTAGTLQRLANTLAARFAARPFSRWAFSATTTPTIPWAAPRWTTIAPSARIAENGIRTLWTRAGNEAERQELGVILRLNAAQLHKEAVARATRLIERAPWFAEAWYQRAAAHSALGRLVESIRDCHQALEINPYHFVAATSMGQAYLQLENPVSALDCFRRALRLNPDLEGVRAQVVRLTRMVEDSL